MEISKTTAGSFLPHATDDNNDGFTTHTNKHTIINKKRTETNKLETNKNSPENSTIFTSILKNSTTHLTRLSTSPPVERPTNQNRYSPLAEQRHNNSNTTNNTTKDNNNTNPSTSTNNQITPNNKNTVTKDSNAKYAEMSTTNSDNADTTLTGESELSNDIDMQEKDTPSSLQKAKEKEEEAVKDTTEAGSDKESDKDVADTNEPNHNGTNNDDMNKLNANNKMTKTYGTKEWCTTGHRCKQKEHPADPEHTCQICKTPIHTKCGIADDDVNTCYACLEGPSAHDNLVTQDSTDETNNNDSRNTDTDTNMEDAEGNTEKEAVQFEDGTKKPAKPKDKTLAGKYGVTITVRSTDPKVPVVMHTAIEQFMDSFKIGDPELRIMSTPDNSTLRISAKSLCDKKGDPIKKIDRYTSLLKFNKKKEMVGKVFMTSNVSFALILKNQNVKLSLRKGYSITVRINNLDTAIPSKAGFFMHKLIRGDSIYNYREYIRRQLPPNHPPFQVEPGYIGAGKDAAKRSIQVMMISTKFSDADVMATLLESHFNNPTHMSFVKMRTFMCLDTSKKLQLIRSQTTFAKQHRTFMIWDIESIQVTVTPSPSSPTGTTLKEWLQNIKTSNGENMFLEVIDPIDNNVEVMIRNTSEYEARMWLRGSHAHIARAIDPVDYSTVFKYPHELDQKMDNSAPWTNNKLPEVIVLLDDSDEDSKTTKKGKSKKENKKKQPRTSAWQKNKIPESILTGNTADSATATTAAESLGDTTIHNDRYSAILSQLATLQTHDEVRESAIKAYGKRIAALEANQKNTTDRDQMTNRVHILELTGDENKLATDAQDEVITTITQTIMSTDAKVSNHIAQATELERRVSAVEEQSPAGNDPRYEALEAQVIAQQSQLHILLATTDKRYYKDHKQLRILIESSPGDKDRYGLLTETNNRKRKPDKQGGETVPEDTPDEDNNMSDSETSDDEQEEDNPSQKRRTTRSSQKEGRSAGT
jgi:hypothetical protein